LGSTTKQSHPQEIDFFTSLGEGIIQVSCGIWHSLFLTSDKSVYSCGAIPTFTPPPSLSWEDDSPDNFIQHINDANEDDDNLINVGHEADNERSEVVPFTTAFLPERFPGLPPVRSISAGSQFSIAVADDDEQSVYILGEFPRSRSASELSSLTIWQ